MHPDKIKELEIELAHEDEQVLQERARQVSLLKNDKRRETNNGSAVLGKS